MTRSFEPGSTLLPVSHGCFGELSPFFDVLHRCSLSNQHFYCFCQNNYGEEIVRLHGEGGQLETARHRPDGLVR
jgi:hypothetical protein